MNIIICVMSALAIVLAGAFLAYSTGYLQFNYPSRDKYTMRGIDVSSHQGNIDWSAVSKEEISFVYLKATEGGDWKDKLFQKNWKEARKAGFKVGAYHFFTLCKDGLTQAENFIASVPAVDEALEPAIDLEYLGNCSKRPPREEFLKELDVFVYEVQAHYKKTPILYTNYDFYRDYFLETKYAEYRIWISNIFFEPDYKKYPSIAIWQYAHNARIKGIQGSVDVNVYTASTK